MMKTVRITSENCFLLEVELTSTNQLMSGHKCNLCELLNLFSKVNWQGHVLSLSSANLMKAGLLLKTLWSFEFKISIITHLAGQTYVWHGCKWNFAGLQIYLQPAKIESHHFVVLLKFLVCNKKYCKWRINVCQNFSFQVCLHRTTSVRNIRISDCVHT